MKMYVAADIKKKRQEWAGYVVRMDQGRES